MLAPVFLVTTLPVALVAPFVDPDVASGVRRPVDAVTWAYTAMAVILARAKEGGAANVFLPVVALAAVQLARNAGPAYALAASFDGRADRPPARDPRVVADRALANAWRSCRG